MARVLEFLALCRNFGYPVSCNDCLNGPGEDFDATLRHKKRCDKRRSGRVFGREPVHHRCLVTVAGLVIYALGIGDGILALSPLPGSGGAYADDLDHIRDWKPALVISLTTDAEFAAVRAGNLGVDLQAMGCRWVHLPIEDFNAPSEAIIAQWAKVSQSVLQALSGGGRVLVHCRGGCGRSGMVALRLMIESGEEPDQALARLRGVRACAIETADQMAWARAGRAVQPGAS